MKAQRLFSYVRRATDDYNMINDGDKIAVGISGGKDSLTLLFLSLIYEGRFHCFSPVTYLDKMELTVIRPLMYVPEADIIGFTNKYELPVAKSKCPVDGHTKREYVKNMVKQLNKENPGCKERFFRAVLNKGFD